MSSALAHLRIVEIGHGISGPYCAKLLADLGADVIKVESPMTGDPLRLTGSFATEKHDPSQGCLFRYLNANKRSVECDLGSAAGMEMLLALVKDADLVIENLGAGALESFNIGLSELEKVNPQIALIRISDFGQTGPYASQPASDLTVQASANWVSNHHVPGLAPVQSGGRIADYTCLLYTSPSPRD